MTKAKLLFYAPDAQGKQRAYKGFINKQQQVQIPVRKKLYIVSQKQKYGIMYNDTLRTTITYDFIEALPNGAFAATTQHKTSILNSVGKLLNPKQFDSYQLMNNHLILVSIGNKWGIIDQKGRNITPLKYNQIMPFVEQRARVKVDSLWGYIDPKGKEITPIHYRHAEDFFNGKAAVSRLKKPGTIDLQGKESWYK